VLCDEWNDSTLRSNGIAYLIILLFGMQMKQLSKLLDEDPAVMERRSNLAKRLELYRSAQAEIDAVAWSK
jgi:hypothetical protein